MIGKRSRQSEQLLVDMKRLLDRIDTALIVRDPGTSMAADAYEGLRKQVVASATARLQHMAQLAEFDVALRRGASTEDLLILVDQWLRQAGIERIDDPTVRDVWESTPSPGADVEVDIPAYADSVTNRLVRQGRLKTKPAPPNRRDSATPVDTPEATVPEAAPVVESASAELETPVATAGAAAPTAQSGDDDVINTSKES